MRTWPELYTPLGSLSLTALVAVVPIAYFFVALEPLRIKGHVAGSMPLGLSILIAIFAVEMPVDMDFASAGYGYLYGLWPIGWIIVAMESLYSVTIQLEIIRSSVLFLTNDQHLQVLLIGLDFGAFLDGAVGFDAPLVITAALIIEPGFTPLYAAGFCLIANTVPVAFGVLGGPIIVAGQVGGIAPLKIGAMASRQLSPMSAIAHFLLVAMMAGWRGMRETWPAALIGSSSFAVTQYLSSNFVDTDLPDITSALVSLVCLILFLKFWQPWRRANTTLAGVSASSAVGVRSGGSCQPRRRTASPYTREQTSKTWSPLFIIIVLVTVWTLKSFKAIFASGGLPAQNYYSTSRLAR